MNIFKKLPFWLKTGLFITIFAYLGIVVITFIICEAIFTGSTSCVIISLSEPADGPYGYPVILSVSFLIGSFIGLVISIIFKKKVILKYTFCKNQIKTYTSANTAISSPRNLSLAKLPLP